MNIDAFSTYWIVWGSRIFHPDEAHKGAGFIHFDGHLVMRQSFVVALGLWLLLPPEGLDDAHLSAAIGAWFEERKWDDLCGWWIFVFDRFCPK